MDNAFNNEKEIMLYAVDEFLTARLDIYMWITHKILI